MATLRSFYRRHVAGSVLAPLYAIVAGYGVYLVYVAVNLVVVPHGTVDPIHRLTGITRTFQFKLVSFGFGTAVWCALVAAVALHFRFSLDFRSTPALRRSTTLLFVLLYLNAAAASLEAVLTDLHSAHWGALYGWVGLVLIAQAALVYGALRVTRSPVGHLLLIGGLSGLNSYALYLVLVAAVQRYGLASRWSVILAAIVVATVLLLVVTQRAALRRGVNLVLACTAAAPLLVALLPADAPPPATDDPSLKEIAFRSRPNIHLVSMDSLSPSVLVRKYLGLEDMAYEALLRQPEVVVFRNAFVTAAPTKPSLNSIMRLAHGGFPVVFDYFAGRRNGPVTQMLRANGYLIAAGTNTHYLGAKGPYVDVYYPTKPSIIQSALCSYEVPDPLKFFSFCELGEVVLVQRASSSKWPDEALSIVSDAVATAGDRPVFTFHYIYIPIGHTAKGFRSGDAEALQEYQKWYRARSIEVATILERFTESLVDDGSPSILFVFGDHGPWLSRTASGEDQMEFIIQDRFGVLAALLLNETDCAADDIQYYSPNYATVERLLAGIFRCLAEDKAAFDAAMDFAEPHDFESYVYE